MKTKFAFVVALLLLPVAALAHGDGFSYEALSSGYFIDIGYDDAAAGEPVTFDLGLFDEGKLERVAFEYAWVRIAHSGATVFAGPVSSMDFGKPGFTILLAKAGDYIAEVKFVDAGKTLVEASFPFEIQDAEAGGPLDARILLGGVAVAALSCALGWVLKRHA